MAAHHREDRPAQSAAGNVGLARHVTRASGGAGWQQMKWRQEQERQWEGYLRSLQQCIGELLLTKSRAQNSVTVSDKSPIEGARQ